MQIAWRLKSLCFRALDWLPEATLYGVQKRVTRRAAVPISEIEDVWRWHADSMRGHDRLLEFGAGKNLAQNLYLSTFGFQQTPVDLHPMADLDLICAAVADLRALGLNLPNPPSDRLDLRRFGIQYIAPLDMRATPFADSSFDCCISTNTLEHIPAQSIREIFAELRRVIRPGGLVGAQIDYSDHYAHTDPNIGLANYLRFSDARWRRHNHSNHYQNRLRHVHYGRIAAEAGFQCLFDEASKPCNPWPSDARPELLTGSDTDRYATGRYIWRNP